MCTITTESLYNRIRIKIDGIIHLSIPTKGVTGIQTWQHPDRNYYAIELYTECGTILCEYQKREMWVEILKLLEEKEVI